MTSAGTLWRTLRHLRPEQIVGRVVFRLNRPAPDLRAAPPRRALTRSWLPGAPRAISMEGPALLRLLNESFDLDRHGWNDPSTPKLLRYNIHYFDDLVARDAITRAGWHADLLSRWIAENPPAAGLGWDPYPVSLRIVNWIKWFLSGALVESSWVDSLAVQARWLSRRLEHHLLGNHLFANAKALMFAGVFFEGAEADQWRRTAHQLLLRELPEQILPDGGQFELTPMYHALALEDVLDLLNLLGLGMDDTRLRAALEQRVAPMFRWLSCMTHPDGTLARFNDCADGIAPANADLEAYAARLGHSAPGVARGTTFLEPSGYVRAEFGAATLFVDCARIGADYLPGHAHADTLSFELSLGGERVLVNGGTSRYGTGPERLRERGTAAHNTVEVAGRDSSEVWGPFRVGRRARPLDVSVSEGRIAAAHDGYRFLAGSPVHRREYTFGEGHLSVEDAVVPDRHASVARYHAAPGFSFERASESGWILRRAGRTVCDVQVDSGTARVEPATVALAFGQTTQTQCLAVTLAGGRAVTRFSWKQNAHPIPE
jgi:uncharacterized heparinase superfamily protein